MKQQAKMEMLNQLQQHVSDYIRDYRDLPGALRMATRTGIIIADIQLPRILELSIKAKERFKLIHD